MTEQSPRVLVARCDNYREDVDQACHGEIRFRWGMSQSGPCDVCGSRCGIAVAEWERVETAGAVPETGQAREPGYERIAAAIAAACEVADLDLFAVQDGHGHPEPTYLLAKVLDKAGLIDWNAFDEPSGDTVQAPDAADLAYARSEVDKWLASTDPYCILPTRTEHIPALLARLDELEGTR